MNWITHVFPVIAMLLIALFFTGLPDLKSIELQAGDSRRLGRRDLVVLCAVTAAYAVVAFWGLGDTKAPQSFYRFERGESVTIELMQETELCAIRYYPGLNTGAYTVETSEDGEVWSYAGELTQKYADLFKWQLAELTGERRRFIRITADSEMYLGEISIPGAELASCNAPELFDEQTLVPEGSTYRNSTYFDEVYHARTAFENLNGIDPYECSHPPLGKLIIALGISLFGMTPFGWRFAGTLFGVLMLPVLYVFLKRLFGKTPPAACGTLIFAFDFMHFTQTRIATIDTYGVFFILLMYLFMYLYLEEGKKRHLALSGLFFGIGAACKWTCLYAGAGLAVIWLVHWIRHFEWKAFIKNCLFCIVFFVIVPAMIYYVSYIPYGTARGMHGIGMLFKREYADIVLGNQSFMLNYHAGVHSEHPYSSRWWQWIFDIRPILYYLEYGEGGARSSFGAFVNPVLCWAGLLSMFVMGYLAIFRRDRKAEFILLGYLAQLVPWMFITRTTFAYHYFPSTVFLTLALAYVFYLMQDRVAGWRVNVYGLTAMSLVLFVAFYPVLSGMTVNAGLASGLLKWFPSWPF